MSTEIIKKIALNTNLEPNEIKKIAQENNLEKIIETLTDNEIAIDYLENDSINTIIEVILTNEKLRQDIKKIPESFWNEIKENKVIVYSELITIPSYEDDLDDKIIFKHQTIKGVNMPAIVYQKANVKILK